MWSLRLIVRGRWGEIQALVKSDRFELGDFLTSLEESDPATHIRIVKLLDRIAEFGPPRNPYQFKQVRNNLYEIKSGRARMFGFYHPSVQKFIIITHGWSKGARREQTQQIKRAEHLRDEYIATTRTHK